MEISHLGLGSPDSDHAQRFFLRHDRPFNWIVISILRDARLVVEPNSSKIAFCMGSSEPRNGQVVTETSHIVLMVLDGWHPDVEPFRRVLLAVDRHSLLCSSCRPQASVDIAALTQCIRKTGTSSTLEGRDTEGCSSNDGTLISYPVVNPCIAAMTDSRDQSPYIRGHGGDPEQYIRMTAVGPILKNRQTLLARSCGGVAVNIM
jgi:hypothetical protein